MPGLLCTAVLRTKPLESAFGRRAEMREARGRRAKRGSLARCAAAPRPAHPARHLRKRCRPRPSTASGKPAAAATSRRRPARRVATTECSAVSTQAMPMPAATNHAPSRSTAPPAATPTNAVPNAAARAVRTSVKPRSGLTGLRTGAPNPVPAHCYGFAVSRVSLGCSAALSKACSGRPRR